MRPARIECGLKGSNATEYTQLPLVQRNLRDKVRPFDRTVARAARIRDAGYGLVERWHDETDVPTPSGVAEESLPK